MDGRRLAASLICATILLASPRWSEAADCIVGVVDGDSLRVDTACLLPPPEVTLVRLSGIDAPELRGKCSEERRMAAQARKFVWQRIVGAGRVDVQQAGREKYGRPLVAVVLDGHDLASDLIMRGIARRYSGEARLPWCPPS